MNNENEAPSQVIPFRAEIRCAVEDEYVEEFKAHFKMKELNFEIIIEDRPDIEIRFYDVLDTWIDLMTLPHKD